LSYKNVLALTSIFILLQACGGDETTRTTPFTIAPPPPPPPQTNAAPIANPGLDQIVQEGALVTLFGGQSADPEGADLTFEWSITNAPTASSAQITGMGEIATFNADIAGDYTIALVVNDGEIDSEAVEINVTTILERNLALEGTANGQWPSYSGNLSSNKYSPLDQINPGNVDQLEVAWRWQPGSLAGFSFEATPLFIDNTLYLSTSMNEVAALNAETGELLWIYDTEASQSGRPPTNGFLHRGVTYDESTGQKIIYMPTNDGRLIALNAISGRPMEGFGTIGNGTVNSLSGVPRLNEVSQRISAAHDAGEIIAEPEDQLQFGHTSPGIICNDVYILGSGIDDGDILPPSPPGDVRAYNLETGELMWEFHTVPREGEFGFDTWADDSALINGHTNVWAPMSADEELGMVYLPVSGGTNHHYGGQRPGDNLFTSSIVALNCATGERVWHFQTVHNDLWDYDVSSPPNLIDITVDGVEIPAVAQVGKTGYVYTFNRITGEPVWPIVEIPVPQSDVPGEITSPTQPMPTRPPPFVRQGVDASDLLDPSSIGTLDTGPLFSPPTENGRLYVPSEGGGANWTGASYDPETQMLYVGGLGPLGTEVALVEEEETPNFFSFVRDFFTGPAEGGSAFPGVGAGVTAFNMNTGELVFQVEATRIEGLIGIGGTMISGDFLYYANNSINFLSILDKDTGRIVREIFLNGADVTPQPLTSVPMTYEVNGRQFIVVASGRGEEPAELIALALPN